MTGHASESAAAVLADLCAAVREDFHPHQSRGARTVEVLRRAERVLLRACDPDCSYSGIDQTDLIDPEKVWRCDGCGQEGTSEALRVSHSGSNADSEA